MKSTYVEVVRRSTGDTHEAAALRLEELVRFFRLVVDTGARQVPSNWVDEAWHALLEQPDMYRQFLTEADLPAVRHVPGLQPQSAYEETRQALLAQGANLMAWPLMDRADCGPCSGDDGRGGGD